MPPDFSGVEWTQVEGRVRPASGIVPPLDVFLGPDPVLRDALRPFLGKDVELFVRLKPQRCEDCEGTGRYMESLSPKNYPCLACGGSGKQQSKP